jgi:hypothetical protein
LLVVEAVVEHHLHQDLAAVAVLVDTKREQFLLLDHLLHL